MANGSAPFDPVAFSNFMATTPIPVGMNPLAMYQATVGSGQSSQVDPATLPPAPPAANPNAGDPEAFKRAAVGPYALGDMSNADNADPAAERMSLAHAGAQANYNPAGRQTMFNMYLPGLQANQRMLANPAGVDPMRLEQAKRFVDQTMPYMQALHQGTLGGAPGNTPFMSAAQMQGYGAGQPLQQPQARPQMNPQIMQLLSALQSRPQFQMPQMAQIPQFSQMMMARPQMGFNPMQSPMGGNMSRYFGPQGGPQTMQLPNGFSPQTDPSAMSLR